MLALCSFLTMIIPLHMLSKWSLSPLESYILIILRLLISQKPSKLDFFCFALASFKPISLCRTEYSKAVTYMSVGQREMQFQ